MWLQPHFMLLISSSPTIFPFPYLQTRMLCTRGQRKEALIMQRYGVCIGDNENVELVMKETIFMRVLFCKIHCPFMCFCKPAAAHLYASRPLKLEHTPQVVVSDSAVCSNSFSEVKVERVDETNSVPKSCMRKVSNLTKEAEKKNKKKKRVQWMDDSGKQLAEIKVFESSEMGDTDNEEESTRCLCVIL